MTTFKRSTGIKPYLTKIPLRAPKAAGLDLGILVILFVGGGGGGGGGGEGGGRLFKCYFRSSGFLYAAV